MKILRLLLFEHCKFQLNQSKIGGAKQYQQNSTFDPKSSIPSRYKQWVCVAPAKQRQIISA
jgi:hypothetical protein